ncbi:hypothetical protein AK830_g425 [Neonectria ditissima]|uniref:Uncharacterized protein n=1 Tax=Neonectria ditissima TaxID=78410 RepID=A0A0P7BLE5_9HYPO|nr:hypothetical protein AK830_g425 [Neonectria ditissima]
MMFLSDILNQEPSPQGVNYDVSYSPLVDSFPSESLDSLLLENLFGQLMPENPTDGVPTQSSSTGTTVFNNPMVDIQPELANWARTFVDPNANYTGSQDQASGQDQYRFGHSMDMSSTSFTPEQNPALPLGDSPEADTKVCYGMIHKVDVKLVGNMSSLLAQLSQRDIQTFTLTPKTDHVLLLLPDGTKFGHPRGDITKVLSSLLGSDSFEFEAVALSRIICRKISKVEKAGDAIVQVDINIYGPSSQGTRIGEILTKDKVWLQRPDYYNKQFLYVNPHVIRFPELEGSARLEELENEAAGLERRTNTDVMQLVAEVQQSTHRAEGLERVTGDGRLKTELLDHQERGLGFMLQRESGEIPDEYRLWERTVVEDNEIFVHRITKKRESLRPDEKGGGVLADEMGMGKTLSILALVIKTIGDSHAWAEQSMSEEVTHSEIQHYAHSTLIIVPSACKDATPAVLKRFELDADMEAVIINSWVSEINIHLGDAVKVIKYHGEGRERDVKALSRADIVLTTYKTLATDYFSKKLPSTIHSMGWFRIVLDEGHNIRRPATTFHRACAAVTARSRWCLTGTPIQNKLEDIGSLFVFLRADEFESMASFRRYLVFPFEQQDPVAKERLVMLYDSLVLRRTKEILHLPGQEERIQKLELSPSELHQYTKTTEILNRYIRQQVGEHEMKSKFGLFQAHLQLRILCNHGTHQKLFAWKKKSRSAIDEKEAFLAELGLNAERMCAGCGQPRPIINSNNARNDFVENCAHIFCRDCLDCLDDSQDAAGLLQHCPLCAVSHKVLRNAATRPRTAGHIDEQGDVIMEDADNGNARDGHFVARGYSTKMTALVKDVKESLDELVMGEDGRSRKTKSIIFSCWTRTLDLVEVYLKREKIEFLRVDGECLMSKRQRILDQFSRPNGPQIMLMTTGTGAFGLNLTAANRIFILELQWNPSVENQAIARAIRLRQSDKVIVTRYMMMGTVEQHFLVDVGNMTSSRSSSPDAEGKGAATTGEKHQIKHDSPGKKRTKTEEEEPAKKSRSDSEEKPDEKSDAEGDESTKQPKEKKNVKEDDAIKPSEESNVPSNVLEKGIVYFFIRGRVNIDEPEGVDDIARSFMILRSIPTDARLGEGPIGDSGHSRLLALPKKTFPKDPKDKFMTFVDMSKASYQDLKDDFLASSKYDTKTVGTRHTPQATPIAEGVYAITTTGRESHLAYILTLPQDLDEVQKKLGLKKQGSFVLSTKNPKYPGPANARLPESPDFPEDVLDEFRDLRWMPSKPAHLNYVNAQILLIGEDSGIDKATENQDEEDKGKDTKEVLEDLEEDDLKRMQHLEGDDAASIFADLHVRAKDYPALQLTF